MTNQTKDLEALALLCEVGFVEYRSLWHALWKESLSVIRTWRHARRYRRGIQQWYGLYITGTELRIASVGPWQFDRAKAIEAVLRSHSSTLEGGE